MLKRLHYNTVTPLLKTILLQLMNEPLFDRFRLVGGTSLSLQIGNRESVDIDLFSDAPYDSIDFNEIESYFARTFAYTDSLNIGVIGFGKSYFLGNSKDDCVKVDLYYTDTFIRPVLLIDSIRLASIEDIIAMKIDVISRTGRKKDFWDIHELLNTYTIEQMLQLHKERNQYTHERNEIVANLTNFTDADSDFEPKCLKHKIWELIKLDIIDTANTI